MKNIKWLRTGLRVLGVASVTAIVLHLLGFGLLGLGLYHGMAHAANVNVYTERQPVFLEKILSEFESETGIEVNVLYLDKGLIERLRSEGAQSPADVGIVADIGRLSGLDESGLVQPIASMAVKAAVPPSLRPPTRPLGSSVEKVSSGLYGKWRYKKRPTTLPNWAKATFLARFAYEAGHILTTLRFFPPTSTITAWTRQKISFVA